ncbi:uncharacterized protein LOC116126790 [Pistacia vera]|uniref:uncharacterized protein LOC116126790 n=1 Tax=Pistacia vera TaxID=55513 RepID=UPI001262E105|nr:uncharacterized protein LOC116126790 [Pistacia vera]
MCIRTGKIFTGWRQQELVSRLLTRVPEESHNSLLEASKSFAEGRTSLDIYVSYLKATVGLSALIESVGIGKGKEDLTSLSMEPVKINQVFPVCPKMPCGKACSSLTSSDIIKFLTGGFRLSKARCNDIFWEAVWPRLLARGWHSEQPKNQGYITSKDYLVFLMPGIKKFSRRKLVKGDHYFDSVSDILSKVASEPKLLELEAEESRVSSFNGEDQWVAEDLSDQDDPSNRQPHCYLKPRTSNCNSEQMKFMVVDSSLVHGGKSSKVRELRFLPVDFKNSSKTTSLSRENKGYFENFLDEHKLGAANIPLNVEKKTGISEYSKDKFGAGSRNCMKFMVVDTSLLHGGKSSQMRALRSCPVESKTSSYMSCLPRVDEESSSDDSMNQSEPNAAERPLNSEPDASNSLLNGDKITNIYNVAFDGASSNEKALNSDTAKKMEICQDQKANKSEEKMSKRIIKHHFSRRAKSGNTNNLGPLIKRRRLTACAKTETIRIIENFSGNPGSKIEPFCASSLPDADYNDVSQVGPSLEKISLLSCSTEGGPEEESSGGIYNGSCFGKEMSQVKNENQQNPLSIDLNHSHIPLDSENGELVKMEVEDGQGTNANGLFLHENEHNLEAQKASVDVEPRRQSTRNRPLTAKALEALACGFLSINKKEKSKEFHSREIPFSTPSRRARSRVKGSSKRSTSGTGIADLKKEEEVNETFIVNKDITSNPIDQCEEKSPYLLGNF